MADIEELRQKYEASQNLLESEQRQLRQSREDLESEKLKFSKVDETLQQKEGALKTGNKLSQIELFRLFYLKKIVSNATIVIFSPRETKESDF